MSGDLAPFAQRFPGDLRRPAGFIFVSSPNSVTPAHFDIEHSIPMQVQGERTLSVGVFETPGDKEREIGRYWSGSHGRIEVMPITRATFGTEPGFGAYIPPLQPHWIENGPSPSVSMTLTFFTRDNDEDSLVRAFNQHLIDRGPSCDAPGSVADQGCREGRCHAALGPTPSIRIEVGRSWRGMNPRHEVAPPKDRSSA